MKPTDLTQGSIFRSLWIMAVPLISASFVQMAYSMTDMLWLGHLGSESVAAAGAAGFFTWLCNALSFMTKIGAEITISQSIGAKDKERAAHYAAQAVKLSALIGILYACFIFLSAPTLIGLFHFDTSISDQAITYMRIIVPGLFFQFNNNTFSGLYNGQGDSRSPFKITAVGLIVNILLDPLLIYGYGPFPALGTAGAAIATVLAQLVVYSLFARRIFSDRFPLGRLHLFSGFKKDFSLRIIRLGLPVSMQNALFAMFSLTLATVAARWGAVGVATQSIGAQIEAISWMTAAGFSTALAAFTGQNYGAGNYERIRQGYRITLKIAGCIGLFAGILFFVFNREIFSLFVTEETAIDAGGKYLKILAISQLFMVTESVTAGAFNGYGHTIPPALTSILLNAARIPMAFLLVSFPFFGLTGIWWSITLSSILKGILLPLWYLHFQRYRMPKAIPQTNEHHQFPLSKKGKQ
ncbi:MAG: MATE family efflux transporter [Odoribacter sp.]